MKNLFLLMTIFSILFSCTTKQPEIKSYNEGVNIVPKPLEISQREGKFTINKKTEIVIFSPELKQLAENLSFKFKASTGYQLPVTEEQPTSNAIVLSLDNAIGVNDEGYLLDADPKIISIKGATPQGVFYGVQTLLQLLPAEIESTELVNNIAWDVPAVNIKDEPRFKWRGMHLDICRHFLSVGQIKKQLDVLAIFKINTLHLHLTDDQGWRIEVKKYPKLTETGAKRTEFDGTEYGGFLTQEEIKDIVAYARQRYITVVPEIEMPGHAMAALTAYPELSCTGGPFKVRTVWGIEEDVFCAGKEEPFIFLENVLNEIIPLFPGTYFHVGGDECPKSRWEKCPLCKKRMQEEKLKDYHELQSYFIRRVEKVVNAHGKKMIGWDEILEGGIAPSATIMSWRGEEGGIAAANMNHDAVMTPNKWLYLDYYQADNKIEPVGIGGYNTLQRIYEYEPVPDSLPADKHKHILGAQGNVWSEYLYTPELMEYRAFPRIIALAEVTWTSKDNRDYKDFERRINNQLVRLDEHKINYHIPQPEQPNGSCNTVAFTDQIEVGFQSVRPVKMVYTLDETEPATASPVYEEPLKFTESEVIKIRSVLPSGVMSKVRTIRVEKQTYAPAVTEIRQDKGLDVKTVNGRFIEVKDLDKVEKWEDKTVKSLKDIRWVKNYGPVSEEDFFASILTGFVNIPEDGIYYFSTNIDQFWLDNQLFISNENEVKRYSRNDKSVALAKGLHPVKFVYLSNIMGGWPSAWEGVKIRYRKSNQSDFQEITDDMFFR